MGFRVDFRASGAEGSNCLGRSGHHIDVADQRILAAGGVLGGS